MESSLMSHIENHALSLGSFFRKREGREAPTIAGVTSSPILFRGVNSQFCVTLQNVYIIYQSGKCDTVYDSVAEKGDVYLSFPEAFSKSAVTIYKWIKFRGEAVPTHFQRGGFDSLIRGRA